MPDMSYRLRVTTRPTPSRAGSRTGGPAVIARGLERLGFRFEPRTHALPNRGDVDLLAILRVMVRGN